MAVAVLMLILANLAVLLVVLFLHFGPSGWAQALADQEALLAVMTTFPALAAGQVANLLVFVFIAVAAPLLARVPHRSALGLGRPPLATLVFAALGILGMGPLADRITRELKPFFPAQSSLELIEKAIAGHPWWALLPFLALCPALGEEVLCRGVLQRSIQRPWLAIPISAVFFAALHFDPLHMAGVLPLGFYLAWLGQRTGSLWVPVAAHFANNAAAVVAMVVTQDLAQDVALGAADDELPLWAVPAGLVLTALMCLAIHRSMRAHSPHEPQRDAQA